MKTVGIRELKNRLSEYIRHVRSGEIVPVNVYADPTCSGLNARIRKAGRRISLRVRPDQSVLHDAVVTRSRLH